MTKQVKALRKKLWQDMTGCECKKVINVAGKTVTLKADEMCTVSAVRCNGRMNRILDDYESHGLKVGSVKAGETGLVDEAVKGA